MSSASDKIECQPVLMLELGRQSFLVVRSQQEQLVRQRARGACDDTVIYCEHDPVLTLGIRLKEASDEAVPKLIGSPISLARWQELGVNVVRCSRGGHATYHGPGQLVIYPVISLRERRIGPRRFVELLAETAEEALGKLGIDASFDSSCPGLWVDSANGRKKIGSIGLRIVDGVSDHGISINLSCDLEPFRRFSPCGTDGERVTSATDLLRTAPDSSLFAAEFHSALVKKISIITNRFELS